MKAVIDFVDKYGIIILVGILGAVINRLRKNMSWGRFFASIIISVFVSLCVGIIAQCYFNLPEPVIFVVCGLFGTFSELILDEIQDLISKLSDVIIKILIKKHGDD